MYPTKTIWNFLILICCFFSCSQNQEVADLIIVNASIWTADENNSNAEAMAISGDKILMVGKNAQALSYKKSQTKVLDLNGQFVTPGFIDSHVHMMTGGRSLLNVDLRDAKTPKEFSQRVGDFSKTLESGEWIMEGNWDHTLWGGELPQKEWIDSLTPNTPVLLFRLDWHMALANTAALKFAGIDKNTPDVKGGEIIKNKDGELTGLLKDNAMNLVLDKIPPMNTKQKDLAFSSAQTYFVSNGVTTVHDVDGLNKDFESYSVAKKYRANKALKVRIYAATPLNEWRKLRDMKDESDDWLKTGCLKGFVDGSLGSHTAAFHDHYSDNHDDHGLFINTSDSLYNWILNADQEGQHIFVHAIGDSANHEVLDIFERVVSVNGAKDRRFRIEHAQHLLASDFSRFKQLGVIASMQPYHAIDDGRWAEEYIGSERIKTSYAFNSLLSADARLAFGSDWAVAPASPLQGIYAAVTRRTLDGKNPTGWVPEQKISVEEALRAYTYDAAYASFDEATKGALMAGKLADFVILSNDITQIPAEKIREVVVLKTFVGGRKVYDRALQN